MIPLNNHVMIQPLETDNFMQSDRTTYQEVGIVLADGRANGTFQGVPIESTLIGSIVYFDSWLAKKYPVKGEVDKFVWFVKYEDIVAYEPVPEKSL